MYEYEVKLMNGTKEIIFGYNYQDALRRSNIPGNMVERLIGSLNMSIKKYQKGVDNLSPL